MKLQPLSAESRFRPAIYGVIHALVDSLWIQGRPGMDYEAVRQVIEREAGGNGSLCLALQDPFAFDGLVSLDARLDITRSEYFAAIRASIGQSYQPGYDASPFVEFFLGAIVAAADFVLARIRGMANVQADVRRDVIDGTLPPAMLDALVYAWISRSLRAAEYRRITGRTAPTASRDLGAAAGLGYLVAEGVSRDRWYRMGPRLLETAAAGEPDDPRESTPRV